MSEHMTAEQLRAELADVIDDLRTTPGDMRAAEYAVFNRSIGRLESLAARLSGMAAGWQPIETAPRDSRKILVGSFNVYGEWRTRLAWWRLPYEGAPDKQCSWCYDKDGTLLDASIHSCGATHWQPLPAAPEPPHV